MIGEVCLNAGDFLGQCFGLLRFSPSSVQLLREFQSAPFRSHAICLILQVTSLVAVRANVPGGRTGFQFGQLETEANGRPDPRTLLQEFLSAEHLAAVSQFCAANRQEMGNRA